MTKPHQLIHINPDKAGGSELSSLIPVRSSVKSFSLNILFLRLYGTHHTHTEG